MTNRLLIVFIFLVHVCGAFAQSPNLADAARRERERQAAVEGIQPPRPIVATPQRGASADKVSVRMTPMPNQTVRLTLVQENAFDISIEGEAPPGLAGPMKMVVKTTTAVTQKYGARRPNGNIPAEITYDDIRVEGSMNGQSLPGANPGTMLIGKTVSITYDRDGNVTDTQIPSEAALPAEAFKQLLNSAYGNLPTAPMGIDEVVTAPLNFTLPLPVPGSPPLTMEGTVKMKLASIDQTSAGRIAKFESSFDATLMNTLEIPSPNGTVKMAMDFKMSGGGTTLKDVEKGLVRSSEDISNFEGRIKLDQSGPGPLPNMSMKGIIKVTLKATN